MSSRHPSGCQYRCETPHIFGFHGRPCFHQSPYNSDPVCVGSFSATATCVRRWVVSNRSQSGDNWGSVGCASCFRSCLPPSASRMQGGRSVVICRICVGPCFPSHGGTQQESNGTQISFACRLDERLVDRSCPDTGSSTPSPYRLRSCTAPSGAHPPGFLYNRNTAGNSRDHLLLARRFPSMLNATGGNGRLVGVRFASAQRASGANRFRLKRVDNSGGHFCGREV